VREAQEVERLRPSEATRPPIPDGMPSELDQACLLGVQLQAELREPLAQVGQEPVGCVNPIGWAVVRRRDLASALRRELTGRPTNTDDYVYAPHTGLRRGAASASGSLGASGRVPVLSQCARKSSWVSLKVVAGDG